MSEAKPLKLFVSYAHQDEADRDRFGVHLAALQAEGYYEVWHDRKLGAGQDWAQEIDQHLAEADVVVLLVSADLINSRYVWSLELEQALRQEAAGTTHLVSVILRPCRWHRPFSPLASRQALPPKLDRVKSVSEHPGGKEKAFDEVMEGLEKLCEEIRAQRQRGKPSAAAPGAPLATGSLPMADRVRLSVGRRPWQWVAAAVAAALAAASLLVHGQLQRDAEFGWHLLRIGEYAAADAKFVRARWWPGLDDHGAEVARLGRLLPQLADEKVRREFDAGLAALERAAPGSAFVAYLKGVTRFDDWRLAADAQASARWFAQMQALYHAAVVRDPLLAEAHAGLAFVANIECRLNDALAAISAAISAAERAAGTRSPARYEVQRAEILSRFGDTSRRDTAMQIFEARGHDPRARLLQAMLAWQSGQWALGRDKLADAIAGLDRTGDARAWLLYAPGGPWLLGETDAKHCLLRYAGALAEHLAEHLAEQPADKGGTSVLPAWEGVAKACPRITEDARDYLCAQLPEDGAAQTRSDLRCPSPQPTTVCKAPRAGEDARPPGKPGSPRI